MPELTKDARKALKSLYSEYRNRRDNGQRKAEAVQFNSVEVTAYEGFDDACDELRTAGYIKKDIIGNVALTDKAIIFMENIKMDTLMKWVEFGTQFIP